MRYKLHILNKESINYDYTVNNLVYDIANDVIIDLTGFGIIDLFNKKIRIPVPSSKYMIWATSNWKKPLIYFKLMIKGFTPIDDETEHFIINYIETNFEEVYMRKINVIQLILKFIHLIQTKHVIVSIVESIHKVKKFQLKLYQKRIYFLPRQ